MWVESTGFHWIIEVRQHMARIVLGWMMVYLLITSHAVCTWIDWLNLKRGARRYLHFNCNCFIPKEYVNGITGTSKIRSIHDSYYFYIAKYSMIIAERNSCFVNCVIVFISKILFINSIQSNLNTQYTISQIKYIDKKYKILPSSKSFWAATKKFFCQVSCVRSTVEFKRVQHQNDW